MLWQFLFSNLVVIGLLVVDILLFLSSAYGLRTVSESMFYLTLVSQTLQPVNARGEKT